MKRKKWVEWYHEGVQIVALPDEYDAGIGSFFLHHDQEADPDFINRLSHQLMRNAHCIFDDDNKKKRVYVDTRWRRWIRDFNDGIMRIHESKQGRGAFYGTYVYSSYMWDTVESYPEPMPELGWHADCVGRGWIALMDSAGLS